MDFELQIQQEKAILQKACVQNFLAMVNFERFNPFFLRKIAWEALQDPSLIFLCFSAMVSFIVGIVFQRGMEWIEVWFFCPYPLACFPSELPINCMRMLNYRGLRSWVLWWSSLRWRPSMIIKKNNNLGLWTMSKKIRRWPSLCLLFSLCVCACLC